MFQARDRDSFDAKTESIDLSDRQLERVIIEIPKKNNVKVLNLSKNHITDIISTFPKLQELNISNNLIKEISSGIQEMLKATQTLNSIDLSSNELSDITPILTNLPKLAKLNVANNKLTAVDFSNTAIKYLDLRQNKFKAFPILPAGLVELHYDFNPISQLKVNLLNLVNLSLSLCKLESLSFASTVPALEYLDISMNRIQDISFLSTSAPNLRVLIANDNFIKVIPQLPNGIRELNLRSNAIKSVPLTIEQMKQLTKLDISENHVIEILGLPQSLEVFIFRENPIEIFNVSQPLTLTNFDVSNTKIESIHPHISTKSTDFLISHTNISKIDNNLLNEGISTINISWNRIESLPDIFNITSLKVLNAEANIVKHLPNSIFYSNLTKLNVSFNKLDNIPSLPPSLIQLKADSCNLTSLPNDLVSVKILSITGNKVSRIPPMKSLTHLYASKNNIVSFSFGASSPTCIDLSLNPLTNIECPSKLPNLIDLDLSFCQLRSLPASLDAPNLQYLKLSSNPLPSQVDLSNFSQLIHLDIVGTKIKFDFDPNITELYTSSALNASNCKGKVVSSCKWASYSEMRGERKTMEDQIVFRTCLKNGLDVFGVFDGHGGTNTAKFASKHFAKLLTKKTFVFTKKYLSQIITKLAAQLQKKSFIDGSTMAAALLMDNNLLVAHLGDARVQVYDDQYNLTFTTVDHKPFKRNEFERIVDIGGKVVSRRTDGVIAVSRSLGDQLIHGISSEPEVSMLSLSNSDRWLIVACDGVFDVLSEDFIGNILMHSENAVAASYNIRNAAFGAESRDNISVIAVDLKNRKSSPRDKQGIQKTPSLISLSPVSVIPKKIEVSQSNPFLGSILTDTSENPFLTKSPQASASPKDDIFDLLQFTNNDTTLSPPSKDLAIPQSQANPFLTPNKPSSPNNPFVPPKQPSKQAHVRAEAIPISPLASPNTPVQSNPINEGIFDPFNVYQKKPDNSNIFTSPGQQTSIFENKASPTPQAKLKQNESTSPQTFAKSSADDLIQFF